MVDQNLNYNEVIVVEGKNDKARISALFPNATIVTTNGSEISDQTLLLLENIAKTREIILFLDPDFPGERIRHIISNRIPKVKHAFVVKKKAIDEKKHKVGVEHAKDDDLLDALNHLLTPSETFGTLTMKDLLALGLVANPNANKLRARLAEAYNLGNPNGKTLLKRLNFLNISYQELEEYLNEENWDDSSDKRNLKRK